MKNLTKYLLLLLISLGTVLFFVLSAPPVFAGEWANRGQTCTQYCASTGRSCITTYDTGTAGQTVGGSCSSNFTKSCDYVYPGQICCECQVVPTATPIVQAPTSTKTATPTPTPVSCKALGLLCSNSSQCCSGNCDPTDFICVNPPLPTSTPIPAPKLVWQKIAECGVPTSAPTPTTTDLCSSHPNCSTCLNDTVNSCKWNAISCKRSTSTSSCPVGEANWLWPNCQTNQCGTTAPTPTPIKAPTQPPTPIPSITVFQTSCPTNSNAQCGAGTPPAPNCKGLLYSAGTPLSNCTKELPNCWSCPLPTPTPTPSAVCNDSNTVDNECFKRNGVFCAVDSSCKQNPNNSIKDCTCQSSTPPPTPTPTPTITPTPIPTPTPTPIPVPGSVQLALALAQQGLTSAPVNRSRSVTVVLKGTDDQIITKIGTADFLNGTFNGTINLGVLPSGSYKLKVKVGNFLKSLISNLVISGTAASAQTTVVAGLTDQFNDNVDAISFYANGLRTCFGSTLGVKKCGSPEDVDLNGDANVDVIDYQIYLKGIRSLQQGLPVQ